MNYLFSALVCLLFINSDGVDSDEAKKSTKDTISLWNSIAQQENLPTKERLFYAQEGLKLATKAEDQSGQLAALNSISSIYVGQHNYPKAVVHFEKALSLVQGSTDEEQKNKTYHELGRLQSELHNYNQAITYYEQVQEEYTRNNVVEKIAKTNQDLGVAYAHLGEKTKALIYFEKALEGYQKEDLIENEPSPLNGIGRIHLETEPEKALDYFQRALEIEKEYFVDKEQNNTLGNIGMAYWEMGKKDSELFFLDKSIQQLDAQFISEVTLENYQKIAEVHNALGNKEQSLDYYQKWAYLKDSLNNLIVKGQSEMAKIETATTSVAPVIKVVLPKLMFGSKDSSPYNLQYILSILMGLGLLSMSIIAARYGNRLRTKRQNINKKQQLLEMRERLLQSEIKTSHQLTENLKRNLLAKEKDLTDFALDINRKNEFTDSLLVSLGRLEHQTSGAARKAVRSLIQFANNHQKVNQDQDQLQQNIDKVNHNYFAKLQASYPDLSKTELQLCAYIRLGMTTKEIATTRNVNVKSVEMARYRLRKKLELSAEQDITTFLKKI
ncbi:MAG: DUF2225 domain-containing protein [Saprospiraceae bacterium]|nr:DUF2225 domain-containing protein [Saprospiraceae bacterium]